MAAVEVITAATTEPLTVDELKLHLRVEVSTDDPLITRLIADARKWAEDYTRRGLISQTWRLYLDEFPLDTQKGRYAQAIKLPGGKVNSVEWIKYLDGAGVEQTLDPAGYTLLSYEQQPSIVVPAYGTSWPGTRDFPDAIQVQYSVGAHDASGVAATLKQAVLQHSALHYEDREGGPALAAAVRALERKIHAFRLFEFG